MKTRLLILMLLFSFINLYSQNEIVNIWDIIPNSKHTDEQEIITYTNIKRFSAVKKPTLEIFLPSNREISDKAVIICPGGGYKVIAYEWEGSDIAKWFNSKGITAFVLKYRLPTSKSLTNPSEAPIQDAKRAMRWVRFNAKKWNINPNKIGIMGFSAGGHLASTLGTQYGKMNNFMEQSLDTISARPDFMALIYPVITMQDSYTHKGSQKNLLGDSPTKTLKNEFSNELHVSKNTPPTFIVHSSNDKVVSVENSLNFYNALIDKNVKAEMHIYPFGGHGFSLANDRGYLKNWTNNLENFLNNL